MIDDLDPFTITPNTPIGRSEAPAFVDYADGSGALTMVSMPNYSESDRAAGAAFRAARIAGGRSLSQAATLFGRRPAEISGIEHGRLRIEPLDDALKVLSWPIDPEELESQ